MPEQYYLNPFKTRKDKGMMDTEAKYAAKTNCIVITPDDLPTIGCFSTLLIDGHGAAGNENIAADLDDRGTTHEVMSDVQLAMLLYGTPERQPLLPTTHVRIRLLGCYTAATGGSGTCMARGLAQWLGHFGYNNIAVGGYLYQTWSFTHGERTMVTLPEDVRLKLRRPHPIVENFTRSGFVVWFDARGQARQKPACEPYDPEFPTG
jgi:hypothetical protein